MRIDEIINMGGNEGSVGFPSEMFDVALNTSTKELAPMKIDIKNRIFTMPSDGWGHGEMIMIFVFDQDKPIMYLCLANEFDGLSVKSLFIESQARGKMLALKVYLAVSDHFKKAIYSDETQTAASRNGVWQKLLSAFPNRVVGYDQRAKKDLPLGKSAVGPVVNNNQEIYVNKKHPTVANKNRTRLLKLLPN